MRSKLEISDRLLRISELVQHLSKHKVEYQIHMECEKALGALLSYPANFSGLDWSGIPNSKKVEYSSIEERNEIISTAVTQHLDEYDRVFVTWSDGAKPILETTAIAAADNSGAMADEDFDMWILNLENGFCLEHYHEGYVAWTNAS